MKRSAETESLTEEAPTPFEQELKVQDARNEKRIP
jgi:hypothetical protein